jgi:hypothetical protein
MFGFLVRDFKNNTASGYGFKSLTSMILAKIAKKCNDFLSVAKKINLHPTKFLTLFHATIISRLTCFQSRDYSSIDTKVKIQYSQNLISVDAFFRGLYNAVRKTHPLKITDFVIFWKYKSNIQGKGV